MWPLPKDSPCPRNQSWSGWQHTLESLEGGGPCRHFDFWPPGPVVPAPSLWFFPTAAAGNSHARRTILFSEAYTSAFSVRAHSSAAVSTTPPQNGVVTPKETPPPPAVTPHAPQPPALSVSMWACVLQSGPLSATLEIVALQAPLSTGLSRQDCWSGLPCPPPGDLPDPGTESSSLMSPALASKFFTTSCTWDAPVFLEICSFQTFLLNGTRVLCVDFFLFRVYVFKACPCCSGLSASFVSEAESYNHVCYPLIL